MIIIVKNIRKIKDKDGRIADFNPIKISDAIWRAAQAIGGKDLKEVERLTDSVLKRLHSELKTGETLTVDRVQDTIEKVLLEENHHKTAKAYILYRSKHKELREIGSLIENVGIIDDYLSMGDWRIKENSNMSYSLQGLNTFLTESIISRYWLRKIYPPEIGDAHIEGDFHIHDLGTLGAYCVGWDLKDILRYGFTGASGKIESNPAKHFSTLLMQIVNYIYTLQGEAAGAQALSNFDTFLAPFVRYDKLKSKELKQMFQQFLFNMNVPTRVGFQSPFSNITMDVTIPGNMKDDMVIHNGKVQGDSYGDYQKEMDLINKTYAEVMNMGDAKERPFTFPIPTYNITKEFDWENKNLNPVWEMTAKYGIPYFSNFVNSDLSPDDARSMCCRLRLDTRELKRRGGGLFGANPKTGSIGVVTINLPRIGYLAESEDDFLERLDRLMIKAKDSLELKREVIEGLTSGGLHPYTKFYLKDIKETYKEYWKNHFSTIGIIGMNDAILNLFDEDIGTETGKDFALKVMGYMQKRMGDFQEETGNIYNLEATPAEGASYRLPRVDIDRYPDIRVYNRDQYNGRRKKPEPYYTNSTHLPYGHTDDIFDALELQDELQTMYTGGTVFHGFIGEAMPSIEAVKKLVKTIANNYKLPYYTLTPTFSICPNHGYLTGEQELCPICKGEKKKTECEVYSRVVGYLRPTKQWNKGKQQEFVDRKTYVVE